MEPLRASGSYLAELLPEPVLEMDQAGKITYANSAALKAFGYSADDLRSGMSPLQLVVPEERERAALDMRSLLSGNNVEGTEYVAMRKNGSTFFVSVHAGPIFRGDQITGAAGIAINVSSKKAAERSVTEMKDRYDALFNRSQEAVLILDFRGMIMDANIMAGALLGCPRDELVRKNFADLVSPEHLSEAVRSIRETRRTLRPTELKRFLFRRMDGHEILMSVTGSVILKNGVPEGLMCIARDVTEVYKLRSELERAKARSLSGATMKEGAGRFRSELVDIRVAFEYVRRALEKGELDAAKERIAAAIAELGTTDKVLGNMMNVGISEMLDVREFPLTNVLGTVVMNVSPIISGAPVPIATEFDFDRSIRLMGDPDQLELAVRNIAQNALESMTEGGTLSMKSERLAGGSVRITVSDTGPGMDETTLSRLFDPFFSTKEGKGRGFGLAISWRMVQNRGGTINVRSEEGRGSVFEITIPP